MRSGFLFLFPLSKRSPGNFDWDSRWSQLSALAEPVEQPGPAISSAEAMAKIDAWDAPTYNTITAVIQHRYPAAHSALFDGVGAAAGPEAVAGAERFLSNYQALRSQQVAGVEPAEADSTVALLAQRQLVTESITQELRGWIEVAQAGATPAVVVEMDEGEVEQAFDDYREWLNEWREVARATFDRRDYLIMLGLANRRSQTDSEEELEEPESPHESGTFTAAVG